MECGNLRTSHQWLKRKKHSTSKLGAECFIFLCCIFWFVLHWKAECCISWFCVANIFSICCNQWTECCKEKIECCNQKRALRLYHFVSPLPNPVLRNGLSKPFLRFFLFLLDSRFPVRFDVSTTFPPLWSSSGVYLVFVFDVCNGIKLVESACF